MIFRCWLPNELRKERLLGTTGLPVVAVRLSVTVRRDGVLDGPETVYVGNGASMAIMDDEVVGLMDPDPTAVGVGLSRVRIDRADVVLGPVT